METFQLNDNRCISIGLFTNVSNLVELKSSAVNGQFNGALVSPNMVFKIIKIMYYFFKFLPLILVFKFLPF